MEQSEVKPQQRIVTTHDQCIALYARCTHADDTGYITINGTGVAFEIGDTSTADTTVNPYGGTPGTILYSEASTFHDFLRIGNVSANWELWFEAMPPDTSFADGSLVYAANADASAANYAIYINSTTQKFHAIALTRNGLKSGIHATDAGIEWEVHRVVYNGSFSGAVVMDLVECDDTNGSSESVFTFEDPASGVQTELPLYQSITLPMHIAQNRRVLLRVTAATSLTGLALMEIQGRYHGIYSTINKGELLCRKGF